MSTIVLRSVKGSILTTAEVDANFNNLNTDKVESNNPTFTGPSAFAAGSVSAPSITTSGDSNCGIYFPAADTIALTTAGSEVMRVDSAGTATLGGAVGADGFRVVKVASSVNRVAARGSVTGLAPSFIAQGTDSDVGLTVSTKGVGNTTFRTGTDNFTQFRIRGDINAVNYLDVFGVLTGSGPILRSEGTDANIAFNLSSKGTGSVNLQTAQGTTQLQVQNYAGAVNYGVVYGGTTGIGPVFGAAGSDANIQLNLASKGTGSVVAFSGSQVAAEMASGGGANWVKFTSAAASSMPSISAIGSDVNIGIDLIAKAAGSVSIQGGSTAMLAPFQINCTGSYGAGMRMLGDGATTPSKYLRTAGGSFQILNHAYSAVILGLSDAGDLTGLRTVTALGAASAFADGTTVNGVEVGTKIVPQNLQNASYTLVASDSGKHLYHSSGNGHVWTIPANGSVAYPIGTAITFTNTTSLVTIAITTDTMILAGAGTTGSRSLAQYGIATALKIAATTWIISGTGLS
jgi:hypothetical protein